MLMNHQFSWEADKKVHILFFVPSLGNGGAEMHLLRIINHLDRLRFRLSLALARAGGSYESALADDVRIHVLNTGRMHSSTARLMRSIGPLRRVIQAERPNILYSVMDLANIVAITASRGLRRPPKVVVSMQNPPSINYRYSWHIIHRLLLFIIPRLYPCSDRIIALSRGVAEDIVAMAPQVQSSTEVIYNAGVDARVFEGAGQSLPSADLPQNSPLIVACGRLTEQKGFPYLIAALAHVRQYTPAHLWILGEGEQRQRLEGQIRELNLTNSVRVLGFQPNPYKYMAAADLFVLSSLWEGFGNVIVEAMACGTPVVATDCPYGPAEIIQDGVNGVLVPPANVHALSDAIIRVLTDQALKQRLSKNGQERSQDFHARGIASAYGEMFLRVVSGTKTRSSG